MKKTNPQPGPILPPHDPETKYDSKELARAATWLIDTFLSDTPESKAIMARIEREIFRPAEDDLRRVEILEQEGRTIDEAWVELDRIKRAAGINPKNA
jgi:hypothetical protein